MGPTAPESTIRVLLELHMERLRMEVTACSWVARSAADRSRTRAGIAPESAIRIRFSALLRAMARISDAAARWSETDPVDRRWTRSSNAGSRLWSR